MLLWGFLRGETEQVFGKAGGRFGVRLKPI